MKNALLITLFTLSAFCVTAQDSTVTLNPFEKMATKPGSVCKFTEKPIGELRRKMVTVIKISNFNGGDTLSAIRIAPSTWNSIPIIDNSVIYLQKEDIAAVIKLLEFYAVQLKNNATDNVYYSYVTSNDVQFFFKYGERSFSDNYLTIRKLYYYLRIPVQFSSIYFDNKKDIDRLVELLKEAAKEIA